jgi:hypothetical protein
MDAADNGQITDPCGEFGPVQKSALAWFFSVIAIGVFAVYQLCKIDRHMYDSNAETLDYSAYRDNRLAQVGIRSDLIDPRSHADSVSVIRRGGQ